MWGTLKTGCWRDGKVLFSYDAPVVFNINDQHARPRRFVRVSCGTNHVLALADDGAVYSFGCGKDAKLGHGNDEDQCEPKLIEALSEKRIVAIAAGEFDSYMLTADGVVLKTTKRYWLSDFGDSDDDDSPIETVKTPHGVFLATIAVGRIHCLGLTDVGEALSFGCGEGGKLGHGDTCRRREPKIIDSLHGVCAVAISAGGDHSVVLTDTGEVFTFGCGKGGKLGHGDELNQHTPKRVEALRGVCVTAIATDNDRTLVLTCDDTVAFLAKTNSFRKR